MQYNQYLQVMTNTKWEEIREAMFNYPIDQLWRTKDIETGYICPWDGEWYYHFKLGEFETIEWLEIKAETDEIRNDVLKILNKIHVPGEVFDNVIRVYGYVETGRYIDYL
ncbi:MULTISPECIES: DUF6678 family protein [Ureibacillus]|uniref:Uncharacterized protein n=2 Tax=Ureibacillus TaxID=160795 RepID=A0A0A3J2J6_9BACL|nr:MULTISPECIES: DUF6678 family protein [Ureibacillus]KGR89393.1 hypothetical protein CD30_17175 [Ureibacillus massiliensis 4400831 = CIP 108448 = CCUG 49529]MCM3390395.1 hypothetical protein [Ureibacillus chungkukjangi]PYF08566.1 hypothetical protein BJ095_102333 [Ureibacillus chungkukjangi]